MTARRALLVVAALLPGCDELVDPPAPAAGQRVAVIEPAPVRDLDILFVLDNSDGMAEPQQALIAALPALIAQLPQLDGGLPDLHVGVVSSDLGAGRFLIPGCVSDGDGGRLQAEARAAGCTPPADAFVSDVGAPDGTRDRNFGGTLAEALACIAPLGVDGCGFEQHLESMRRALDGSVAGNAGFLRADAHLLIVVLADEDDCSAADPALFDPSQTDPLGPLSSFRCFEHGVTCEVGNDDPRAPGERQGCAPREDSAYLFGVQTYLDFLRALKDDAGRVSVATIVGAPVPVAVAVDPSRGAPALVASCRSGFGVADPAVRLSALASQLPARNVQSTICSDDGLTAAMTAAATLASNAMTTSCLTAPVTGSLAELAARCRGFDVTGLDSDAEQRTAIPSCAGSDGGAPCLRLVVDDRCTLNAARASVVVDRVAAAPAGSRVVIECTAP